MFRVCRDPLNTDIYSALRRNFYKFTDGQLSSRQLQALCEVNFSQQKEPIIKQYQNMYLSSNEEEGHAYIHTYIHTNMNSERR